MNKDYKVLKKLNGHSGCFINLIKDGESIYVSKMSKDINYNYRLKMQCKKQKSFVPTHGVYSPRVHSYGYKSDLFYFNMQFVQGKTMAEYTNDIKVSEIVDFIRLLFKNLYNNNDKVCLKAEKIFNEKILTLEKTTQGNKNLQNTFIILKNFNWSKVQKSFCHGDLTLENIIITPDKNLYLIDFLDSFYNSWMIDIAKILQDLELNWSFRNDIITSNRSLRLQIAKEALIEELLKTDDGKDKLFTIYHILLLNIVRIYPYTTDKKTLIFLNSAINLIEEKIKTQAFER